MPEVS